MIDSSFISAMATRALINSDINYVNNEVSYWATQLNEDYDRSVNNEIGEFITVEKANKEITAKLEETKKAIFELIENEMKTETVIANANLVLNNN